MIELIVEARCTACEACVAACPTHVFDPRPGGGPPTIARPDQCQTCFMCELYCEADAIYVGPHQGGRDGVTAAAALASGQLGRLRRDYGWTQPAEIERPLADFWRLGPLLREGAQIAADRYARRRRGE
jgi:NAD-dependent dihydropyrimidine dehydrogenase PreA subunit